MFEDGRTYDQHLHELIFAHSHRIAYESLDIMLGRTPKLDIALLHER